MDGSRMRRGEQRIEKMATAREDACIVFELRGFS